MAFKNFDVPVIGSVTIYKRRGTRNIRLSVQHDGSIRVSIPPWVPYAVGREFVQSRVEWIEQQRLKTARSTLASGQKIGKQHTLLFKRAAVTAPRSRVGASIIAVTYPQNAAVADDAVQAAAKTAAIRALRQEAEMLLPPRLAMMAERHNLNYRSVNVRSLSGRWGSCDSQKNIVLNLYLMQLPWELIEYVLLHELTHTIIMKHGSDFWQQMNDFQPLTPQHRKAIREHQPAI